MEKKRYDEESWEKSLNEENERKRKRRDAEKDIR